MENTAPLTKTTYEPTGRACRKCKGSGLFDNGNVAGDCFSCGGTGEQRRAVTRELTPAERQAAADQYEAAYGARDRRAAERRARRAAR